MITLQTLPNATAQEVFEQVANHLLSQNCRSTTLSGHIKCAYRSDGTPSCPVKCAAGCLISDEEFTVLAETIPDVNTMSWWMMLSHKRLPFPPHPQHVEMIRELQFIHDEEAVSQWRRLLIAKGEELCLDVGFLKID